MQTTFWNANGLLTNERDLAVLVTRYDLDAALVNVAQLREGVLWTWPK